jgi:hypothetical protein
VNEGEEQMAFGCYFDMKDFEKYVEDRTRVPSFGSHFVKNESVGQDMIPDDGSLFVDGAVVYE